MFSEKASVYISTSRMLMTAPHLLNAQHQHAMMQVTFSLEDQSFAVWTEDAGWQETKAVIINSNVVHSLKDFKGWQVTTCIVPEAIRGKLLQEKVLDHAPVKLLDVQVFAPLMEDLCRLRAEKINGEKFLHLTNQLYDSLTGVQGFQGPLDARILHVVKYIQEHIDEPMAAAALAQEVFLSEDRFLHLFKEQMGMPLRQYILWQRAAIALKMYLQGKSLKEAAFDAGFADPAHFTRTFVQMNGVPPSAYAGFKNHYHMDFFLQF